MRVYKKQSGVATRVSTLFTHDLHLVNGTMASTSARQLRPDMVASAVSFLRDDKVQQSSVSQRVQFLESKGLTADEIDEAMRQTGGSIGVNAVAGPSHAAAPYAAQAQMMQQQPMYYNPGAHSSYGGMAPQQPRDRDWRDWFIMAVVSGTVGYGVISLARKYLMPHLQPPNQTVLEEDKDALTARYDEVAAQLAALDAETKAVKAGVEEQREKIEQSIADVQQTVKAMRDADKRRSDDMDTVKSEVDAMKESMARMFDKTKEAQTSSLNELQTELKSLKTLLVSRNAATAGGGTPQIGAASAGTNASSGVQPSRSYSPFAQNVDNLSTSASSPSFTSTRPSIPAWQLADSSSSAASTKDDADGSPSTQSKATEATATSS